MFLFRRGMTAALFTLLLASLSAQDVEIVVTATKEPTPAETLPVEVVVLDAEDLKDKSTVSEALESTLAVRLETSLPGQEALVAPGFGENGFARILFLIDGSSQASSEMQSTPLNLLPLFALDRIEIVRGPAAAFYGAGSMAGAVNLVTKVPQKLEGSVSATLDNTLTNRQSLAAGLPVGPGGLLVSASREQNTPSRDRSDSDQYQAWTKLMIPFVGGGVDQELSAWFSVAQSQFQLPGDLLTAAYEADPSQAGDLHDEGNQTTTKGWLSWSAFGSGWSLAVPASVSYRTGKVQYVANASYTKSGYRAVSMEPRLTLELGSWGGAGVQWSLGADLSRTQLLLDRFTSDTFAQLSMAARLERWSDAAWTRLQVSWSDSLFLSTALRYEQTATMASSQESAPVNGTKIFAPLAGQAGVAWVPVKGLRFGIEASRVYRYPLTDEMVRYYGDSGYGNYDYFDKDIEPETGYGTTLSASLKPGPFEASVSATYLSMEGELIYDLVKDRNVNSGKTSHFSSLAAVSSSFGASSAGAEYSFEAARFENGDNLGNAIPLVPEHRGRLWGKAELEKVASADASWTLTSTYFKGGDNANAKSMVPWRQNLEAGATIFLGSPELSLRVFGKNLTNDRTPTTVYLNYLKTDAGWYPLEGRTFGATLAWKL